MKYLLIILPIFIMLTLAPALIAAPSNVYAQNEITQSIRQIQRCQSAWNLFGWN